jgi:glutamine synthetase
MPLRRIVVVGQCGRNFRPSAASLHRKRVPMTVAPVLITSGYRNQAAFTKICCGFVNPAVDLT